MGHATRWLASQLLSTHVLSSLAFTTVRASTRFAHRGSGSFSPGIVRAMAFNSAAALPKIETGVQSLLEAHPEAE
eukprot:381571-Prymnesium_polylepis.1